MPADVRVARVFAAGRVPVGRGAGQSWLTDPAERDRIAGYLRAGTPILMTTARQRDVLDPGRGEVVGASFRTDGAWVWSDALAYYVAAHDLAPEDDLCQQIRANGYSCPTPDDSAQDKALDVLYASLRG